LDYFPEPAVPDLSPPGWDENAVEALGHSTPSITLSIYSHVMPALASEAADRMQEALRGPLTAMRDNSTHQQEPSGTASGRLD
jgi:hypothetical protein